MIELRWVKREMQSGHLGWVEKVLQYRQLENIYPDGGGALIVSRGIWSEWKDVPEVEE